MHGNDNLRRKCIRLFLLCAKSDHGKSFQLHFQTLDTVCCEYRWGGGGCNISATKLDQDMVNYLCTYSTSYTSLCSWVYILFITCKYGIYLAFVIDPWAANFILLLNQLVNQRSLVQSWNITYWMWRVLNPKIAPDLFHNCVKGWMPVTWSTFSGQRWVEKQHTVAVTIYF